jgi:hypothetical protein
MKFPTPKPKLQKNPKTQTPIEPTGLNLGAWNLGLFWDLELGIWSFFPS